MLARRLGPKLVSPERSAAALASAIQAGLSLSDAEWVGYGTAADAVLEAYRRDAGQATVTHEVVPALLRSPS